MRMRKLGSCLAAVGVWALLAVPEAAAVDHRTAWSNHVVEQHQHQHQRYQHDHYQHQQHERAQGAVTDDPAPLERVDLPDDLVTLLGARALDGSGGIYYLRRNTSSTQWVFFLQGGGLCVEPIDCSHRKNSSQGSTDPGYWGPEFFPGTDGGQDILKRDPELNPYFWTFNHVFLPYVSGDTWSGERTEPSPLGFTFAGHRIVQATLAHLNDTHNLGETATDVLLTGSSAGGIGTFQNADAMRDHFLPPTIKFKAAPVSGMYFPGPVVEYVEFWANVSAPINSVASKWISSWFQSRLDESCVAALGADHAFKCWDASVLLNYVEAPLFVVENRFDQNQINDVLLCPTSRNTSTTRAFVEYFGEVMTQGLAETVRADAFGVAKGDGLFVPSCFTHTSNICMQHGPTVQGVQLRDVLPVWFDKDSTVGDGTAHQYFDSCNADEGTADPCNDHCYCA